MGEISPSHFKELANATPRNLKEYKTWLFEVIVGWNKYMRRGGVGAGWLDLYHCVQAVSANANEVGILDSLPRLKLPPAPQPETPFESLIDVPLRQIAQAREHVLRYLSKCVEACNDRKPPISIPDHVTGTSGEGEGVGGSGTVPGGPQPAKQAKPKRGRRVDTDIDADKRVADAWQTGRYKTYEDLGRKLKMTKHQVKSAT